MNPAAPKDDANNDTMDDSPPDPMEDSDMHEMEVVQNPPVVTIARGPNWSPRIAAGGGIPPIAAVGMINRVVASGGNGDDDDDDDDDDEDDDDDDDDEPDDGDDAELILGPANSPFGDFHHHHLPPQQGNNRRPRGRKQIHSPNNNSVLTGIGVDPVDVLRQHNGHTPPTAPNLLPGEYRLNDERRRVRRGMDGSIITAAQEAQVTSSTMGGSPVQENGEVPMDEEEEDEARSEGTFRYKVENISKLKETALSQPYHVRNLPWKIMVMQRSQPGTEKTMVKSLGFFLQCNGDSESSSWSCNATADLRMLRHNGEEPFSRKINHLFYSKENDWGFSHFVSWSDIFDPEKGYVKDDAITLEVHVAADAPHGVSWDSKKHTGFVGLKNQGATCYMNSLLQVLYFTNRLRKAVYKMPTESDDSTRSVPLALQRVFFELQFTDKPVGTKKLTKSFGWETLDSFMQHDVQEFLRVLLDNLESKMKRTSVEGTIPKLFEGKMISYIKCKNVNYSSSRTEPFYDIQLNVKGKKNIYESFRDYIEVETLEGENRYDAGTLGMQDAVKGVQFTKFPPVLYLHLMRFQYDPMSDTNVKINDRFEFPPQLNLSEYLKSEEEDETPATYTLHAVLVHSGDNHGGHYVVFINPRGDGKWCKFDDDVVSKCSRTEAVDHNFGGNDEELGIGVKHCTNAYMLVYIRDSVLSWVLADVTEGDIPLELSERINEEKRLEAARRKERNEGHQYMHVRVVTEDDFVGHQLPDLFEFEKIEAVARTFRVRKLCLLQEFEEMLAAAYNYPRRLLRIWPVIQRANSTQRPGPRTRLGRGKTLVEVSENCNPWNIFVELVPADVPQRPQFDLDRARGTLLFFKLYEPKDRRLYYAGTHHMSDSDTWKDLFPMLNERAGYPRDTHLMLFEEVRPSKLERVDEASITAEKAGQEELLDGDIIVYQKGDRDYLAGFDLPTAPEFYKEMYFRVEVLFCDKNVPTDPGFRMTLSQRHTYKEMVVRVAERLNTDPECIQFFKSTNYRDCPGNALRSDTAGTLKDFLTCNKPRVPKKLFYQLLSIKVNELDRKKQIRCVWVSMNCKEERELVLYPNKTGAVRDLLEEAARSPHSCLVGRDGGGSGRLRLVEVAANKIQAVVKEEATIESLNVTGQKQFRIEEVPIEEAPENVDPATEMLIPCAHFHKEAYTTFGVPFFLKIREGEKLTQIRARVQKKLEVPDKEFEKYRCAIVTGGKPSLLENDKTISLSDFQPAPGSGAPPTKTWFGLEHINKAPKKTRYTYLEKAIKIHN